MKNKNSNEIKLNIEQKERGECNESYCLSFIEKIMQDFKVKHVEVGAKCLFNTKKLFNHIHSWTNITPSVKLKRMNLFQQDIKSSDITDS